MFFNTMLKEGWVGEGIDYPFDVRTISSVTFVLFPHEGPIDFCIDQLGMIR